MITEIVSKYHSLSKNDPHHRYKSWEHCYSYFSNSRAKLHNEFVFDHASLHLAFYLASWGMLRGSSFLLQKDYKVHLYFLKQVVMNPVNEKYFDCIEKNIIEDRDIAGIINNLIKETKRSYMENVKELNGEVTEINVTDTLASKILLGVYGNVPAYDRYFKDGLSLFGINTQFNESSLNELKTFYNENYLEFESLRVKFSHDGIEYTPMKLIDMYFWQVGFMLEQKGSFQKDIKRVAEFAQQYISDCKDGNASHQTKVSLSNSIKNPGIAEIREFIQSRLLIAKNEGKESLDLRSGDIHKELGLYNCMPSVCNAMVSIPGYKGMIIQDTPSGKSSTKVVRYMLKEAITV